MCRPELRQRRPCIPFRQQDGTGGVSGKRVQVRGVELRRDPGKLIGSRARCHHVLGLEHDLDTGGKQARASDRILRLSSSARRIAARARSTRPCAKRSNDIPGSGSRPARLAWR